MAENKEAVKKEVEPGVVVFKLSGPVTFEGETITELRLNFGKMTGEDIVKVAEEMEMLGIQIVSPSTSVAFQYRFAARAAGESIEVIKSIPAGDFGLLLNRTQNFLLGLGF